MDVSALDVITRENLDEALPVLRELAERTGAVIAVSGALDVVTDGKRTALIENGCATMARITGSGCMQTTLLGAFCAAVPEAPFEAECSDLKVGSNTVSARIFAQNGICAETEPTVISARYVSGQELKIGREYEASYKYDGVSGSFDLKDGYFNLYLKDIYNT